MNVLLIFLDVFVCVRERFTMQTNMANGSTLQLNANALRCPLRLTSVQDHNTPPVS